LIGQSASLTGTAAESGQQTRDGALAYFEVVNRKGGVNGRKIKLITLDDGGQTKRGEENTAKLIAEDKVFLLFGYTGRNTSEAALRSLQRRTYRSSEPPPEAKPSTARSTRTCSTCAPATSWRRWPWSTIW